MRTRSLLQMGAALALSGVLFGCVASASSVSSEQAMTAAETCGLDPNARGSVRTLMEAPIASAVDADTRFGCLQQILRTQKDHRAPFATLYARITTAVRGGVAADRFEDGEWVSRYLTAFAELYRVAFLNYEEGRSSAVPRAWRTAFDTAKGGDELVVQDIALGVNAHVDRDLSHALQKAGIGAPGWERNMRARDHFKVNDILHEQLGGALTTLSELYAPGLGKAPAEVLKIVEEAYFLALQVGRRKAWDDAVLLTDSGAFERFFVVEEIELSSQGLAELVLAPNLDPDLVAALKRAEQSP